MRPIISYAWPVCLEGVFRLSRYPLFKFCISLPCCFLCSVVYLFHTNVLHLCLSTYLTWVRLVFVRHLFLMRSPSLDFLFDFWLLLIFLICDFCLSVWLCCLESDFPVVTSFVLSCLIILLISSFGRTKGFKPCIVFATWCSRIRTW